MPSDPPRPTTGAELIGQLAALPDCAAQAQLLMANLPCFDDAVAEALKNTAVRTRLTDPRAALSLAQAIQRAAAATGHVRGRGYGLWAEAIVRSLEMAEYQRALGLYDEAIAIFTDAGDRLSPATMQISRLWSLANLNRFDEAFSAGEAAAEVLREHERWLQLATLQMNLGGTHSRRGEDAKALTMFSSARQAYEELGIQDDDSVLELWAAAVNNCSISRCYLGDFAGSLQDSQVALEVQLRFGNHVEAARVRQHMGVTHFLLGRYNEALRLLQEARDVFAHNELNRHAARVDLYMCDCLLRLRRFGEVLRKSAHARDLFQAQATVHEEALSILYCAMAQAGLGDNVSAMAALADAVQLFAQEGSDVWLAYTHLEHALLLQRQGDFTGSLALAEHCAELFRRENLPVKESEAELQAARVMAALGQVHEAQARLDAVCDLAAAKDVGDLAYRAHHILGTLAYGQGDLAASEHHFAEAIQALEGLRGRLMVEYRVDFQEDKQVVYEDMVDLCLHLGDARRGLEYAERAKSRALLDLLAFRVDLRVRPRAAADQPLVDQLLALRAERDRRYRRWENNEEARERGSLLLPTSGDDVESVRELERCIAELWHTLLIRNAAYAHDADLWQVQTQPIQPKLEADTLLVEYFSIHGQLVVFLVSTDGIAVQRLDVTLDEVRGNVERLGRQLRAVARFPASALLGLARQSKVILRTLYDALLAPVAAMLTGYANLVIVPHDALHYLPFHALHDGMQYLVERYAISYLPSAGLLHHQRDHAPASCHMLAVGYSAEGALPHVHDEVTQVAALFSGKVLHEADATPQRLRDLAAGYGILHLATHAEMHDQQPLFSGLQLADGWLTTLDIFNLELRADLVTLSACQTGRSAIGGGDELLGLMRAFFYAGAASLVLSMWAVEDRSTAEFMVRFYGALAAGQSKREALRTTQLSFIRGLDRHEHAELAGAAYAHPYFWAPFFLAGDPGPVFRCVDST